MWKDYTITWASGFTERASMAPSASENESLTEDTLSSKPCDKRSIEGTDWYLASWVAVNMGKKGNKQYLDTIRHWSIKFSHPQPRPTNISKCLHASCCRYSDNERSITHTSHDDTESILISCTTTTTTSAFQCIFKQEKSILSDKVLTFLFESTVRIPFTSRELIGPWVHDIIIKTDKAGHHKQ